MRDLIKRLYLDNKDKFLNNYARLNDFHNEYCVAEDTTGKPDCWFLYLLVSHLKPKVIFEAGTNVGTTAKFMADAAKDYGGVVHTSDPVNKYMPVPGYDENIVFHNATCHTAVRDLRESGEKIDFAFYDAAFMTPDHFFDLLEIVRDKESFGFAVHDWTDANGKFEKGKQNMDIFWQITEQEGYQLFTPELKAYKFGHTMTYVPETDRLIQYGINGCTAVCLGPNFKV